MNLIPTWRADWRAALRHYSTIALAVATALQSALIALPAQALGAPLAFPGGYVTTLDQILIGISCAVVVLGLIGKFLNQPATKSA